MDRKNMRYKVERYSIFFDENFYTIMNEYPLTMTDIKVFSCMKMNIDFGNRINIKQIDIARKLNINRSIVSKSVKKLEEACVVLRMDGNMYINPHFALKADPYIESPNLKRLIGIANEMIKGTNLKRAVVYKSPNKMVE